MTPFQIWLTIIITTLCVCAIMVVGAASIRYMREAGQPEDRDVRIGGDDG